MGIDRTLFTTPEGYSQDDYVLGTYYIELPRESDVLRFCAALVVEQTTGTWTPVPMETPELRSKHVGKLASVHEIPGYEFEVPSGISNRSFVIQIAFPWINFGHQIPMMLTTLAGNISMAGKAKLLDIYFPEKWAKGFQGPKFGIEGIRKMLGIPKRPLVNNMIKPCTGYTCETGAVCFEDVARGGVDFVKDDELIADASFNSVVERTKRYMEIEKQVYEETGEHTLYTVNITDRPDKMRDLAYRVVEVGGNGLMINYLTVGISALQMLAEDPNINIPILAHLDLAGAFYESPFSGMSSHLVMSKLARLAGADFVVYPNHYGKFPFLLERHVRVGHHLTEPFYHIKRSWPGPAGGTYAGLVPLLMDELGNDMIVAVGGGVYGHPGGATAGAKALRQAIEAHMAGIDFHNLPGDKWPELKRAIDVWGVYDKERKLFDLK